MLHTEIKQRINTCRDILVGKLPDPKSQVIQITNALIYKFMDDQDRLAEKLGGKASFFTGSLKPYAWHKLFDSKLTNQERADLYIEGVQKLSQATNLPELFREIFKEAYVPFRAAQTITLFISEINKFDYTHSEELGNAYEYLLSIMGSQGDAGQFRTPRHIIDFMVDVIDPQKGETIYDPACGTAGFLISAYKHILATNGGKLTANDRRILGENITGVDISPDMAKMARVNLYLHGFGNPSIEEGDTLSDEDLWGTKYDVVLANPPFMSPKGGIIPHDKFGIKAKRAEVLFVDFIAEHLKLKGRAAIVVPEGVIFQSGVTYKALRKMLVEDGYLHAVISLPAGVFQPYSGVKTSILILDREKAKEAAEVLFLKIENDGYTLNTQRSEREGGQLAEALEITKAWRKGEKQDALIASWVGKDEIAKSGDYNLTGERYRTFASDVSTWPVVLLRDVVLEMKDGGTPSRKNSEYFGGDVNWCVVKDIKDDIFNTAEKLTQKGVENSSAKVWPIDTVIISLGATIGKVGIARVPTATKQGLCGIVVNQDKILPKYLFYILKSQNGYINSLASGVTIKEVRPSRLAETLKLPLPPIDVQQEIIAELDRYQKIIDGARQVVENYKPSFKVDPEWPHKSIGEICEVGDGNHSSNYPKSSEMVSQGVPFIRGVNLVNGKVIAEDIKFISEAKHKQLKKGHLKTGDILFTNRGEIGKVAIVGEDFDGANLNSQIAWLRSGNQVLPDYLLQVLQSESVTRVLRQLEGGATLKQFTIKQLKELQIPLPEVDVQAKIVEELHREEVMIESNQSLIKLFETRIRDKIAEVWGE